MNQTIKPGALESVVAIIPARGGSQGIPKKNIKPLAGYPLIAYSVVACKLSGMIQRTIVSTDSEEIALISQQFGAEVPFLRPPEISKDTSTDIEFVQHALDWFCTSEGHEPKYLAHIRPTTPLRDPTVVDEAIRKIMKYPESTGLRSVHETRESPYKLFGMDGDYLAGLFPEDPRKEYYNMPRQAFPPAYQPNGYVDVINVHTVRQLNSLHGHKILAFITPDVGELDRLEDFSFLEFMLSNASNILLEYLRRNFKTHKKPQL